MKKVESGYRTIIVLGIAVLVSLATVTYAGELRSVQLRGSFQLPETKKSLDMNIVLQKLERQKTGQLVVDRSVPFQTRRVTVLPGWGGKLKSFEFEIEPSADGYYFGVEVLDKKGFPSKNGAYVFAYPELAEKWGEKTVPLEGNWIEIALPLKWERRQPDRVNHLTLYRAKDGYEVAFTTSLVLLADAR